MEESRPDETKLYDLAEEVGSKETFLVFLEALRRDLEAARAGEAEQQVPTRTFAQMFIAAKGYE